MRKDEIIRAWRDADYYFTLSDEQRASLPASPAGMVELSDDVLANVLGASHATCYWTCHHTEASTCSCDCYSTCWSGGAICCC